MLSIPLLVTFGHQVRSNANRGSLAVYWSWAWSWCFLDDFLTRPPSSARARALLIKGDHCTIFMLQWTNMVCICTYIYILWIYPSKNHIWPARTPKVYKMFFNFWKSQRFISFILTSTLWQMIKNVTSSTLMNQSASAWLIVTLSGPKQGNIHQSHSFATI